MNYGEEGYNTLNPAAIKNFLFSCLHMYTSKRFKILAILPQGALG
jgi:hypothetical protein